MSRRFVSEHADRYPVTRLCALVNVARSSFYEWRNRPPCQRVLDDAVLTDEITEIHEASQRTYGAPRVHGQLRHRGWRVGRKRVARLMAAKGLVGVHGRRKWRRGKPNTAPAPDLIGGDFTAASPDQYLEVSEATYHRWRNQYGGLKANDAKRLKELERENRRLKKIVAEKELEIDALKELARGNW